MIFLLFVLLLQTVSAFVQANIDGQNKILKSIPYQSNTNISYIKIEKQNEFSNKSNKKQYSI